MLGHADGEKELPRRAIHRYVERTQLVARIRDAFASIYAVHRGLQNPIGFAV
jgi:hypothetical protein